MKLFLTVLFWGTITVYCLGYFINWALPFVASPFVALVTLIAIAAGVGKSSSR